MDVAARRFPVIRAERLSQDALRRRMLALADASSALAVSLSLGLSDANGFAKLLWGAVFVPIWLLLAKIHGLYDRDHRMLRHLTVDELPSIFMWATSGTALLALFLALTPVGAFSVGVAIRSWIVVALSAFTLRSLARALWRAVTPPAKTLIAGEGALAKATRRKLELFPDIHVAVAGQCEIASGGGLSGFASGLQKFDRLILASQTIDEDLIAELVAACRRAKVKLSVVPPARGMFGTAVHLSHLADLPVVEYNTWHASRSTLLLKRVFDIVAAGSLIVFLSPLFALVALAIKVFDRGPVFFAQPRAGRGSLVFRILKFRTMVWNAEDLLADLVPLDSLADPMFKLQSDPRVTRLGHLLRRSSLDELPQLLNVLKGDMSLVGPRPEQVNLVERYRPEHLFRMAVRPGLTGPMQVYGRGQLTFDERLAVEREYVENLSLERDFRLLAMTFSAVFSGRGAF